MPSLTTKMMGVIILSIGTVASFSSSVFSPLAGHTIGLIRKVMPNLEHRRTTRIELHTSLDDIPPGGVCPLCNAPMEKIYLEYLSGGKYKILAENTAGYKCSNCGIEELSSSALLEALRVGSALMASQGHQEEADSFREAIDFELSLQGEDTQ